MHECVSVRVRVCACLFCTMYVCILFACVFACVFVCVRHPSCSPLGGHADDQKYRTVTHKKTLNPEWKEAFDFKYRMGVDIVEVALCVCCARVCGRNYFLCLVFIVSVCPCASVFLV